MKNFGFLLIPIVMIVLMTQFVPRVLASGISPAALIAISAVFFILLMVTRPKKSANKSTQAITEEILDDFCADAFAGNAALEEKFNAALSDISKNMPKAAVSKLTKLAEQCSDPKDKYAVAMAAAMAYKNQNDLRGAVREYNKAVVLHPTPKLAYAIGESNQRLGYLDKARDSYEFAQELDPKNPQYPSSIATTYVGDGMYDDALDYAADALAIDENFPQALATMAICYGVKDNAHMHKHYLDLAMTNGYSESKITETIKTLKKRERK